METVALKGKERTEKQIKMGLLKTVGEKKPDGREEPMEHCWYITSS